MKSVTREVMSPKDNTATIMIKSNLFSPVYDRVVSKVWVTVEFFLVYRKVRAKNL